MAETTPGTPASNTSPTFIGVVQSGKPTPNPNYKQIRAAGSVDFYINQRMSVKPEVKIGLIPSKVAFLTALVNSNQAFSLLLRDATDSLFVNMLGSYVDRCRVKCDVEDSVMVDLDIVSMTTNLLAPSLGSGTWPGDDSTALFYQNVTVSKDGTALPDWTNVEFEVNKNFIRRLTPSTGATRTLTTVARDHSFSLTRDMDSLDAFNEYADASNDTSHTMKVKLTNADASASWSATVNNAKTNDIDIELLKPEELIGKKMTYSGSSIVLDVT